MTSVHVNNSRTFSRTMGTGQYIRPFAKSNLESISIAAYFVERQNVKTTAASLTERCTLHARMSFARDYSWQILGFLNYKRSQLLFKVL